MGLKTVIVDDEARAVQLLEDYVSKVPSLEMVESFQNAIEAVSFLNKHAVDLLLLDIRMPDLSGLQLLSSLHSKPMVIFTTAHADNAVDGFKLDAIDYLVKPITFADFMKAASKAVYQAELASISQQLGKDKPSYANDYLFVKVDNRLVKISYRDILYVEGCGDYVAIYHQDGRKLLCLQTMSQTLDKLPNQDFTRIHKSYIVNLHHVDAVQKDHVLIGNHDISIGRSYRATFFKLLTGD